MSVAEELRQLHLNQAYSNEAYKLDIDNLRLKYSTLPNETAYIIDCKEAQLIPLDKKFEKIVGLNVKSADEITLLYEHVNSSQYTSLMSFLKSTISSFAFGKKYHLLEIEKDWMNMIYKNHLGKTLLKSTSILARDPNGIMRYSIGKLTDITGLGHSGKFSFKFTGPNSPLIHDRLNNVLEFNKILSKREKEILILVGKGMKSQEIATHLNISKATVNTHRKNILRKLETEGSIQAFNKANDMGLL